MYHIVSVEDEPEITDLLHVVFRNEAVGLHIARDGAEALALIPDLRPDLVLLDLMLPGNLDGWDVYHHIRAHPELRRIPVIILTVVSTHAERQASLRGSDIDLYLLKPFDTVQLRREVERMLGCSGLWNPPGQSVARAFGAAD